MTADSDGNIMEKQEKRTETDTKRTPRGHQTDTETDTKTDTKRTPRGHQTDTETDTKTDTKADRQKGAERGCRECRRDCL